MMTVILLQILRFPVPGLIGLTVVVLGIPVAVWLISDRGGLIETTPWNRRLGRRIGNRLSTNLPKCPRWALILLEEMRKTKMAWIRTIPLEEADDQLLKAMADQRSLYPGEYAQPVQELDQGLPGIVASHTLIPQALIMRSLLSAPSCRLSCRCRAASMR